MATQQIDGRHERSQIYNTKKEGQGIGLTIIRDILVSHGFAFSLQAKPEGYTEFLLQFETTVTGRN